MQILIRILISLFLLPPSAQVGYYVYSGTGIPGGTAPVIVGVTSGIGCAGTGGSCTFNITTHQAGETLLWLVTSSAGNSSNPTSSGGETITCTPNHVHGSDQSHVCHLLVATGGIAYTISNPSNVGSFWNAGVIIEIVCAASPSAQCTLGNIAYQDTTGTGAAGTSTAGSITTTHQLNELILGGFTQNNVSSVSTPTQGSPFVICPPEINPACMNESGFGRSYASMERYNATSTGTFQASESWSTLNDTAGFTLEIY